MVLTRGVVRVAVIKRRSGALPQVKAYKLIYLICQRWRCPGSRHSADQGERRRLRLMTATFTTPRVIAAVAVKEGREAWRGEHCC
jgi:hypothetical protein